MPIAPPRPCAQGGCPQLVRGTARCPAHRRPTAQQLGYTAAWATYARQWRARYPWCGMRADGQQYSEHSLCTQRGHRTPARVVDHIRAIAAGGAIFDPSNHQSLCIACNTRKG